MSDRPEFIRHWRDLESADNRHYPDCDEPLAIGAPIGHLLGLTRIGIHHERLPPGRRTSYPHAESAEEEFAFVLDKLRAADSLGLSFELKGGKPRLVPSKATGQ